MIKAALLESFRDLFNDHIKESEPHFNTMGGDTVWMIIYGMSPSSSRRGAVYLHRNTGGVDRLSSRAPSQIASQILLKVDFTSQSFTLPSAYTNNVHVASFCCNLSYFTLQRGRVFFSFNAHILCKFESTTAFECSFIYLFVLNSVTAHRWWNM